MINKVKNFINKHHLICPGSRVVIGVSGGADSVCLLYILYELRKTYRLELAVTHINHGIRDTAIRDEEYVEELCGRLKIPFRAVRVDLKAAAKELHLSEEEAGRHIRYREFEKDAGAEGFIATAHHIEDSAESILLNLFRGSGLAGLAGIPVKRENIIRPLLCLTRSEIEAFLHEKNISFMTDETNDTDDYSRNRIRHHLLPFADRELNSKATVHIAKTGEILSEAREFLDYSTQTALEYCCISKGENEIMLEVEKVLSCHHYLSAMLLLLAMQHCCGSRKDISRHHIDIILDYLETGKKGHLDLPHKITAVIENGMLLLKKKNKNWSLKK